MRRRFGGTGRGRGDSGIQVVTVNMVFDSIAPIQALTSWDTGANGETDSNGRLRTTSLWTVASPARALITLDFSNDTSLPGCGAEYADPTDACTLRFQQLLALDHSHREPWGSRHGQAFAAFVLEHPSTHALSLDAAWDALYRIYCLNEAPAHVFARRRPAVSAPVPRPPRPTAAFQITIADLGDFNAATYAAELDSWCRAALAGWDRD